MGSVQGIERYRGDTYPERATMTVDGAPLDLSGKTVRMHVYAGSEIVIDGEVADAAAGKVEFSMADVSTLDKDRYTFEIKVDDGTYVTTFLREILEIK